MRRALDFVSLAAQLHHLRPCDPPDDERLAFLRRVRSRMSRIDAMSPTMREVVHEFGVDIVDQFASCGVTNPRHIRHLINRVRNLERYGNSTPTGYPLRGTE